MTQEATLFKQGSMLRHPSQDGLPTRNGLPVIAELERHAEIVLAQHADGLLEVVLREGRDADLIGLNRGLNLSELSILDELDDVARGFDRNALLNGHDSPDLAARRRFARAGLEILDRHAAPNQARLHDLPDRVHLH